MVAATSTPRPALSGVSLWLGPDRPRKLQRIQEIERALQVHTLDRHHLDGAAASSAELVALCRQRPAASSHRLILVDHAERLRGDAVEALLIHADAIAATAYVLLLVEEELSVRHALTKASALRTERFPSRDTPAVKPFALIDALGSRDVGAALTAAHDQFVSGKDPIELFGLVAWQVQRWVLVKRLLLNRHTTDYIAAVTGMRVWQVERMQSEVASRTLDSLDGLLRRCWELETDAKTGRAIPGLAIEELLVTICLSQQANTRAGVVRAAAQAAG